MPRAVAVRLIVLTVALSVAPVGAQRRDLQKPLVLASQGSFFVGGETKNLGTIAGRGGAVPAGDVTVNQMYVSYQTPPGGEQRLPVVMVHGCCLSSKTWETTPDGRMGWNEYFVRRGRAVYLADQVSRARSGFDASVFTAVRAGTLPPTALPAIINASHQIAWTVFRFGPVYPQTFPDGQFPIEAVDELYKQVIPDLNALLPTPNPTWTNMAALAVRLKGAVLMGHSESGFFPEQAALIDRQRHPRHDFDRAAVPRAHRGAGIARSRRFRRSSCSAITWATCRAGRRTGRRRFRVARRWPGACRRPAATSR